METTQTSPAPLPQGTPALPVLRVTVRVSYRKPHIPFEQETSVQLENLNRGGLLGKNNSSNNLLGLSWGLVHSNQNQEHHQTGAGPPLRSLQG